MGRLRKPSARQRRYAYRVVNALVGVAVIRGLLSGDEGAAWLLAVNAVLGLADANVTDE